MYQILLRSPIEGFCNLVSQIPNPKSRSHILQTGIWFLERARTTKISPTEKLLWSERIAEKPDTGGRARIFQITASAAVVGYFCPYDRNLVFP